MKTFITLLALATALAGPAGAASTAAPHAPREQRVDLTVTGKGFEPATVHVRAGRPVRLVVTRRTDQTCATRIVVHGYGIDRPLPRDRAVEVRFTPKRPGAIRYACGMDMVAGQLIVE